MNWLDEVVEYINQKGQGLGAGVYDYLNDPESVEELLKYLPAGAMGYTSMEDAARKVFPHSRLNPEAGNQTYVEERGMDKAAKGMEGRFPSQRIGATDTGTRYVEPLPPQSDYSIEAQNKAKAGRWTNPSQSNPLPSQDPRIIRKVGGDFSVGGRGIPNAMRGLGVAGVSNFLPGVAKAIPLGLALSEVIRQIPGWDEYVEEKIGGRIYNLMNSKDTSKPLTEEEWRNTEEAKGLGYGKPESEIKADNEAQELADISRKNQEVIKSGRDLLYNTGATPEEIEKAWGKLNPETEKMEGGVSVSGNMLTSNKQMFPREESPLAKEKGNEEAEEAKFAEQLGRFMGYAKQQIAKHYGIDVDSFDPEREALGNTYRQLMGLRYTTQQYNDVYNKNLTAAINKQKQAMTVMNGLVDDFRVHMGSEKDRKSLAAQRMEESKRRYEENKAAKEEKDKSAAKEKTGDIRKMLDAHYYQYTTPDADGKRPSVSDTLATLNDDYRAEYQQAQEEAERLMRDEKLTPAQAVRKALSKKENKVSTSRIETARNFLAPYKNKETSDPERYQARVDRLKEYGFSDAEIRKAKEGGVQNNAGGTQAKSKYVIKSVK